VVASGRFWLNLGAWDSAMVDAVYWVRTRKADEDLQLLSEVESQLKSYVELSKTQMAKSEEAWYVRLAKTAILNR